MRKVAVIGAAMSRFGKRPDVSLQNIGWPVVLSALRDANLERKDIDAVYSGSAYSGRLVGQRVLRTLGMTSIPVINCENACSSGATAFREACIAIRHEEIEVALVLGIDKLTALGGGVLPGQPDDWEVAVGLSMPALYAMRAQRYMYEHGIDADDLAMVAVKAHKHGALNPYAQFNNLVTVEQIASARPVAEPFTLLHCCPTGDGAAAVVVCSEAFAKKAAKKPVWVAATELNSGRYMTGFRDMTVPEITLRGAHESYELAGIGPEDIDLAEVHDAFTIAELLYYLLRAGHTSLGGRIPVNPSGGLLCKGHPVGATGIAQIVEATWQLRNEAGARQVQGARTALTHCTGGGIAGLDHGACSINIFSV
jgi:acetyl-CoA acetyltransferase